MLTVLAGLWGACALVSAGLLSRSDRAGTGFLWGLSLGPVGLLVVWVRRSAWQRRWDREEAAAEERRKEMAWREWRGY